MTNFERAHKVVEQEISRVKKLFIAFKEDNCIIMAWDIDKQESYLFGIVDGLLYGMDLTIDEYQDLYALVNKCIHNLKSKYGYKWTM